MNEIHLKGCQEIPFNNVNYSSFDRGFDLKHRS